MVQARFTSDQHPMAWTFRVLQVDRMDLKTAAMPPDSQEKHLTLETPCPDGRPCPRRRRSVWPRTRRSAAQQLARRRTRRTSAAPRPDEATPQSKAFLLNVSQWSLSANVLKHRTCTPAARAWSLMIRAMSAIGAVSTLSVASTTDLCNLRRALTGRCSDPTGGCATASSCRGGPRPPGSS